MSTFLRMQDVVASETRFVARVADLEAAEVDQIRLHINEAIKAHQKDEFWFNHQLWERPTEVGKEFYALPSAYVAGLTISIAAPRRTLLGVSNDEMEGWDPGERRQPTHYALFSNQYRIFPIPDAVYTLRLWGITSYPELVNATDSNPWIENAFELIREAAKARVFYSMLHDEQKALLAQQAAEMLRRSLRKETQVRMRGRSEIRPYL